MEGVLPVVHSFTGFHRLFFLGFSFFVDCEIFCMVRSSMCVQVTMALLKGDRLLLNQQSRWRAGIDVTLPDSKTFSGKHRFEPNPGCSAFSYQYFI